MATRHDKSASTNDCKMSASQGHLLEHVGEMEIPNGLAELGVTDAEQVVALFAVAETREHLAKHLGRSKQQLESFVKDLKKAIPSQASALAEQPVVHLYGLGALELTPEMEANALALAAEAEALEAVTLAPAVNLINKMSPIRNQASRGTCVAFTLTAINEYYRRVQGVPQDLSEQHLYYETKLIDGASSVCGTWQSKAAQALASRGQCREAIWPYNPNPPCNNHGSLPATARPNGLNYRLPLQQLSSTNVVAIKTALASKKPTGISIPVYNSWFRSAETNRTGRITNRIGSEPRVGGHAICVVGYQDDASAPGGGYFIIRNSWSTNWGNQCPYGAGYGTISYRYIATDCSEAFALAAPVTQSEDDEQHEDEKKETRTITIKVKGNVNLIIE